MVRFRYQGKHHLPESKAHRIASYTDSCLLGEGTYGKVFPIDNVGIVDYKLKSLVYKSKRKVVKVFNLAFEDSKEILAAEYSAGKKVPHLGMKKPVIINNTAYLVMNYLPGKELFYLAEQNKISDKVKLPLIYKLLLALRDQVVNLGLVHRDLKPENILVVLEPEIKSISLIMLLPKKSVARIIIRAAALILQRLKYFKKGQTTLLAIFTPWQK